MSPAHIHHRERLIATHFFRAQQQREVSNKQLPATSKSNAISSNENAPRAL